MAKSPQIETFEQRIDVSRLPLLDKVLVESVLDTDNLLARLDYPFFVTKALGHDFPEIWDPTVQKRLKKTGEIFKDWVLTRGSQKKFRKVMFANPRGTCKSAGTTIPLVPFAHLHDTEIAAMVMSAAYEQMALKFTDTVRQVWGGESPTSRLVDLFGPFAPGDTRSRPWSKEKMVTLRREQLAHADPTLAAYSVAKGPTSGHFKLGVMDDPTTEELMERDAGWLDKVWDAYQRMPFVLDNDALFVLICTRYDDNDIIGRIIQQEIEPRVRDEYGEIPDDFDYDRGWIKYAHLAEWEVFYDSVYDNYDYDKKRGDVVYPVIWPVERIEDVRKTQRGEAMFWKQLQQKPAARDDAPIVQEQINRLYKETLRECPETALKTIDLHCDFAFKDAAAYQKQSGDWGVIHVCAKEGGYVHRLDGYRGRDSQKEFGKHLMRFIEWVYYDLKSKIRYITYEQSVGHGSGDESTRLWLHQLMMQNPDLPRAVPFPIKRHKQGNKSKLQRIMDTNWAWQEGYVVLYREAQHNYPLTYQMLNQGYSQYDDDADAFADAFHEDLYKKTRMHDLPEELMKHMPGSSSSWTPLPLVHGNFDRGGNFRPEYRTARHPGAQRPSLFGKLLGRD